MRVLLLQLDGKQPNLALMRLAAHHRLRGDTVELRHVRHPSGVEAGLFDKQYGRVYASLIFEKTRPLAERVQKVRPGAIIGGTGWNLSTTLEEHGVGTAVDYSDYPAFPHSLGFTQRGCRLSCPFCVVPRKEGRNHETATIADVWRGDPHPRNVLLLDNDFFGQPRWRDRIREIRDGGFKVSFNQGANVRTIGEEEAEALASVNYRDDSFKVRRLYTAWDNRKDEGRLRAGLDRLFRAGVKPDHVMVYMLIGYWPGETDADWEYRRAALRAIGCRPYPMPFVRNVLTLGFQRFTVGAYDKRFGWDEWKTNNCRPERLQNDARKSLPLMAD